MRPISITVLALVLVLAGCAAAPTPGPAADPALALLGGVARPAPEAVLTPEPDSWDDVEIPSGLTLVVLVRGDDPTDSAIAEGVVRWAEAHDASVEVRRGADSDGLQELVEEAVAEGPDLVVGAGAGTVDLFALLTSQYLEQQFLVVGAQLAEPTENVTGVVWSGSEFRGSGISDPDAVAAGVPTATRIDDGVAAGIAAVVLGHPGIVLDLG